jgi:hypothetical protein
MCLKWKKQENPQIQTDRFPATMDGMLKIEWAPSFVHICMIKLYARVRMLYYTTVSIEL